VRLARSTAPRPTIHGRSPRSARRHARRGFRPDPARGGRKMGESHLLLGPHEQSIGGIGGMGRTTPRRGGPPMPPSVPMLHGPGGRTKSSPRSPHIHTQATAAASRRRGSVAPTFLADEGAPQPPTHKRSPPCLFGGSHHCSPAAVNVCARSKRGGLRRCTQEEGLRSWRAIKPRQPAADGDSAQLLPTLD
jgi:hypothetical protein